MNTPNLKEVVLGILTVSFSIAVFWMWHQVTPKIVAGEFQNYIDFLWPVLGLILTGTFFSLGALFTSNVRLLYPTVTISIGAPFFFIPATNTALAGLAISVLFIIYAVWRIKTEAEHSLGFSATKFLKAGLPIYFTIVSLLISMFFFSQIGEDEDRVFATLLPKSAIEIAIGPLQSLMGLSAAKPNSTIDEAFTELIIEQLKSQGIKNVPQSELARLLRDQREELSKSFGLKLSGKERISDILYEFISRRFRELLGPYKEYLPYASTIAFFFAFKALTFPIYYLTLLITFILIRIMVAVTILKREKIQIEVERLTL